MHRRLLLQSMACAGALASLPLGTVQAGAPKHAPLPLLKPRRLNPGDTLAMVLPATAAFEQHRIDMARAQLEALGFKAKVMDNARARHGYFAGTDAERAADLNAAFADDSISGIFCYSGGWGSPRLLPLLDFARIRKNPKVLLGYSDITALLNVIHQQTGLVTFHGPVMASNLRPWTVENLKRTLMDTTPVGELANPPKKDDELINRDFWIQTLRPGIARGRLVGGNLSLVAALMGTPWQVNARDSILLLEDIDEAPYRLDRMLTQCKQGGLFDGVQGVVFGYCTDCKITGPGFAVEEVLRDHLLPLNVPVFSGFAFGHIREMHTLPIGLQASMDATRGTLTLSEAAVSDR